MTTGTREKEAPPAAKVPAPAVPAAPAPAAATVEEPTLNLTVTHKTVRDALKANGFRQKDGKWRGPDGRNLDPTMVTRLPATVAVLRHAGFAVVPPQKLSADGVLDLDPVALRFVEAFKFLLYPPFMAQMQIDDGPGRPDRHAYIVDVKMMDGDVTKRILTDPTLPPARASMQVVADVGGEIYGGSRTEALRDANWLVNKPRVLEYAARKPWEAPDHVPPTPSGVVYVLGSGPSLASAVRLIPRIRHGVVIAVNEVADYLDTNLIDWYVLHSPYTPPKWWRGRTFGKGAAMAYIGCVAPEETPFARGVRWYNYAIPSNARMWRESLELAPGLPFLSQAKSVAGAAFSLACRVPGVRTVVFVGCDCSYPGGYEYPGTPDKTPMGFAVRDVNRRAIKTTVPFFDTFVALTAYAAYAHDRGIRVVNGSCMGLLGTIEVPTPKGARSQIECVPLAEIIEKHDKPLEEAKHGDTENTAQGKG